MRVLVTNYNDDVPHVTEEGSAEKVEHVLEVSRIRGWAIYESKRNHPTREWAALGLRADPSRACSELDVLADNKPERIERIQAMIRGILTEATLSPTVAAPLRGLLQFARSHTIGQGSIIHRARTYLHGPPVGDTVMHACTNTSES